MKSFYYCYECQEEVIEMDITYNGKHKRCNQNVTYIARTPFDYEEEGEDDEKQT